MFFWRRSSVPKYPSLISQPPEVGTSSPEKDGGFGIYVHWPFCKSKCPYCDFNSHVRETIDVDRWENALIQEIKYYATLTKGRVVNSVFFGGGTPSLMEPKVVSRVLDTIAECWPISQTVEVTLEANPTSVERDRFKDFRAAGVNRVSIGVQSFDDDALRFLGRGHTAGEALKALKTAMKIFPRYSFDLIYALPGQTLKSWQRELRKAFYYANKHLSLYQLTIEPGTAFHTAHKRGDWQLPDEQLSADFYEYTQAVCEKNNLPSYEISNYARPGHECQHNMIYWRYGEYCGVGPGAHGRLTLDGKKVAVKAYKTPEKWVAAVEKNGYGIETREILDKRLRMIESVMMGLRLAEGINLERFMHQTGEDILHVLDYSYVQELIDKRYIALDLKKFFATERGRQRLDAILPTLIAESFPEPQTASA